MLAFEFEAMISEEFPYLVDSLKSNQIPTLDDYGRAFAIIHAEEARAVEESKAEEERREYLKEVQAEQQRREALKYEQEHQKRQEQLEREIHRQIHAEAVNNLATYNRQARGVWKELRIATEADAVCDENGWIRYLTPDGREFVRNFDGKNYTFTLKEGDQRVTDANRVVRYVRGGTSDRMHGTGSSGRSMRMSPTGWD